MGQAVNVLNLPVGVAMAGGLAVFEVYAWFCVGEIIGKRQLIGTLLRVLRMCNQIQTRHRSETGGIIAALKCRKVFSRARPMHLEGC